MGILNAIYGQKIYLDANIFIYAVEGHLAYINQLDELFTSIDQGNLQAVTSELSLSEVLVKPMVDLNLKIQNIYQQTIKNSSILSVIPVHREVLIESAKLRSIYKLRLPDAIHLATATTTNCQTFLTNDQRLKSISVLNVVILSQVV